MNKTLFFLLFLVAACIAQAQPANPAWNQLLQAERQIVLLQNSNSTIPLKHLDNASIVAVSIGANANNEFTAIARKYQLLKKCSLSSSNADSLLVLSKQGNTVFVPVYTSQLTSDEYHFLVAIQQQNASVIICAFANPSAWLNLVDKNSVLVLANDSAAASQQMAAQLIFGGIQAKGVLAAALGKFKKGFGLTTPAPTRFKYTVPEDAGIDGQKLEHTIDSIVNDAIGKQAFPGCVVLVAKDRKVVFNKAYGYHTYFTANAEMGKEDVLNRKTDIYDLYDLASVSKVTAGAPAWLKLTDEGKIDLNEKFSHYFPWFKGTDKENVTVKELLCHVGGLVPDVFIYKQLVNKDGTLNPDFFSAKHSAQFPIRISPTLFVRKDIDTFFYNSIAAVPLLKSAPAHKYVYSDLPFVMTPAVVEPIVHQDYEDYLQETFYRPLGASELMYNPWRTIPLERIAPTEQDNFFRQTLLHGFVHDESSGIMGGHSANAGIFANANDLAKLMELYLEKGTYGGERYFSAATFDLFNSRPFEGIDRGIVFDKPDMKDGKVVGHAYCSAMVSPESFGHSGYTGTEVWIDPKYNLVYVFLCNRVYPTRASNAITTLRIRAKIQTAIYEAMKQ